MRGTKFEKDELFVCVCVCVCVSITSISEDLNVARATMMGSVTVTTYSSVVDCVLVAYFIIDVRSS